MSDAKLVQDMALRTVLCGASQDVGEGLKTIVISPPGKVESLKGIYIMDREAADAIVAEFDRQGNDVPIDWEHESLGEGRAPAAGWITRVWFDERRGLMGMVRWNGDAQSAIRSGQYKYLSPVLAVRRDDRRAVELHSAALTNKPAIPRMEALAASQRNFNTEVQAMAEHAGSTVEAERLLGELRSLLVTMGDELPEEATREVILRDAIEKLKELQGDESGESESKGEGGSADDAEIASSVRRKLGLPAGVTTAQASKSLAVASRVREVLSLSADAGADEVVLAMTTRDTTGASTQLAVMREAEREKWAQERVAHYVKINIINPHNQDSMTAAMSLAREDPNRFEALMGGSRPYVPAGKTQPPAEGQVKRTETIAAARRELEDNPALQRLTNKSDHVNQALREAGLPKLSDAELQAFQA